MTFATFDTLQKSRLILKLLTTVCILTSENFHAKHPNIPAICYKLVLHLPLTLTITSLMWFEVVTSSDLNQATDVLYIALTETALVVKLFNVWFYDTLIKSLFNEWQQNEIFKLQTRQECFIWRRTMKVFGILSFLYITFSLSALTCAFIAVVFLKEYQLPFPCWIPFNWKNPSSYWYAYFYQLLAMSLTCLSNSTLDMFFSYILQHLTVQFKLTALRLESLGSKEGETSADISKKLLAIIEFHQKLISMSKSCEKIVSYPFLIQILLSALVLCFSLYRMQNFNILQDPINFLSLVQYAAIMNVQILLPCFYSHKLTIQSSRLLNSIYNCNWPQMSSHNQKIILQYMQYLQKPVTIQAGRFFNVGLATYGKTINNAYSFFALLLNMDIE